MADEPSEQFFTQSTPQTSKSDYGTFAFICTQLINQLATVAPVRVVACTNSGGLSPTGTVDVQVLIDMVTSGGQTFPHGTIFNVPYFRLYGGANAVILDPVPGDIGAALFCMRDISSLKAQPAAALSRAPSPGAPPGSNRKYAWSDALYLGGFLNVQVPAQYVRFSDDGMELVSATRVRIAAPLIVLDGPVEGSSTADFDGDVTGDGTSLHTHTHSGVQPGGGNSGPPNP